MIQKYFLILAVFTFTVFSTVNVFAAVGCDLNDPDRDVKRFFKTLTNYKTTYYSIEKNGGQTAYKKIENLLGDKFNNLYETIDVPHTVYTILENEKVIGYIHGVNQKAKYGGMQVFLVLDPQGTILQFYFQKLTSKEAKLLRSQEFALQFAGLSLKDFINYNVIEHTVDAKPVTEKIKNPMQNKDDGDFYAALRGVKLNLLLMEHFVFHKIRE